MVHTQKVLHARETVYEVPKAQIRLWVAELDCFVGITKAELERLQVGKNALPDWEVDIFEEKWGKRLVFIIPTDSADIPF